MNALRQLWDLLTGSISTGEFERFLRQEVPGAYSFYRRTMRDIPQPSGRVRKAARFAWYLTLAFLEKLTPVRRLLFAIAILSFGIWLLQDLTQYVWWSVLLLILLLVLEVADKLVTKNELAIAREIQLGLLPSLPATPAGHTVECYTEVANSVGGDYYDTIECADGSVLFVLADVSGKGISAALYTTTVQTALRLFATETQDPRALVLKLDSYLRGQLRRTYFLTLLIAHVTPEGSTTICRAGHPGALHADVSERSVVPIRPPGAAIGMTGGADTASGNTLRDALQCTQVTLDRGDILLVVSDGLLEAVDLEGKEYGEERLRSLAGAFSDDTPTQFRDRMLADLKEFRKGADLRDDITFLILRRDPATA